MVWNCPWTPVLKRPVARGCTRAARVGTNQQPTHAMGHYVDPAVYDAFAFHLVEDSGDVRSHVHERYWRVEAVRARNATN
jgi:hypothetical protein